MTANAFIEDRLRCLEAGMNDHISKPIDPQELYTTIQRWLPSVEGLAPLRPQTPPPSPHGRLDTIPGLRVEQGLRSVRGKIPSYERLLGLFAREHASDAAALRASIACGDNQEARRIAHTLKGLSATLGAEELRWRAQALEQAIADGDAAAIHDRVDELEASLLPLLRAIRHAFELTTEQPSDALLPWAQARAQVATLSELLDADSATAISLWTSSEGLFRGAFGPDAEAIGLHIQRFEFDLALERIRQVSARRQQETALPDKDTAT
jgi:HPt (histidine-containing phosphotransfer) domain-containing protein